jgi:uncharacterized protein YprB with RNaseH-like and TPR domain
VTGPAGSPGSGPGGFRDPLRPGLLKALASFSRAAGSVPPAADRAPAAGPTLSWEQRFSGSGEGFPEDLFGAGFTWEDGSAGPIVFWDLETCGLADAPIFLIGALRPEAGGLCFRRTLARDPSGEPALLRAAAALLGEGAVWVTFNGRSFDAPRIRRRAALFGIEIPLPAEHRDLLVAVRRRWKGRLPDCRLGTVERRLLGLTRATGDVPGREVPERYRDYVQSGNSAWIHPVLEHNRRDVAAMAVLYRRLLLEGEFR